MAAVESGVLSGEAKELALNEMIKGVIPPYLVLSAFLFTFAFDAFDLFVIKGIFGA